MTEKPTIVMFATIVFRWQMERSRACTCTRIRHEL